MIFSLQIHRETETFYSVDASQDAGLQEKKPTSVSSGNNCFCLKSLYIYIYIALNIKLVTQMFMVFEDVHVSTYAICVASMHEFTLKNHRFYMDVQRLTSTTQYCIKYVNVWKLHPEENTKTSFIHLPACYKRRDALIAQTESLYVSNLNSAHIVSHGKRHTHPLETKWMSSCQYKRLH